MVPIFTRLFRRKDRVEAAFLRQTHDLHTNLKSIIGYSWTVGNDKRRRIARIILNLKLSLIDFPPPTRLPLRESLRPICLEEDCSRWKCCGFWLNCRGGSRMG